MKLLTIESKKFLKNLQDKNFKKFVENSNIVLVSADLRSNELSENVFKMPQLVPAPAAIQVFQSNDIVKFTQLYYKYLHTPAISVIIATLFNQAAKDNRNLIFMCSTSEDQYGYLELLGNYCQAVYDIDPVRIKDIVKDKSMKGYEADNSAIMEIADERFERAVEAVPNVIEVVKSMFSSGKDTKKKKKKKK